MRLATLASVLPILAGLSPALAQVVSAPFASQYGVLDLGVPPGVPAPISGVVVKYDDPNVLLVAGLSSTGSGAVYSVRVARDAVGHITGFIGTATRIADAAAIDGGLSYGPGNVLFFGRYPTTAIGEIKPGSAITNRVVDLASLGVASSVSSINFVPAGYPGAGRCKLATYPSGVWWDLTLAADGNGTFGVTAATQNPAAQVNRGPEGFAYVPQNSALFTVPTMLITEWSYACIAAYALDENGDPKPQSRTVFISGLSSPEGAHFDAVTGDFLYCAYSMGHLYEVQGFGPTAAPVCYANCDFSVTLPVLNANDFACFLNSFAAGQPYANCDSSTAVPMLNALDFVCFLTKFAAGCP